MKNISVIGAGTMGNGIAHVFAQNGFTVTLIDISQAQLDKAIATITKNLDRQVAKTVITEDQKASSLTKPFNPIPIWHPEFQMQTWLWKQQQKIQTLN